MFFLKHSFRLMSRAEIKRIRLASRAKKEGSVVLKFKKDFEESEGLEADKRKRLFLKLAGVAGVGALASLVFPGKANALVFGSTPASNVVGLKDVSNNPVSPAKEGQLPAALTDPGGNLKVAISEEVEQLPSALTDPGGNLKVAISEAVVPVGLKNNTGTTINPATQDTLATLSTTTATLATEQTLAILKRIAKLSDSLGVVDSAQRQRTTVENTVATTISSGTITTVTGLAGVDARYLFIDTARNTYANGIRNNLTFS